MGDGRELAPGGGELGGESTGDVPDANTAPRREALKKAAGAAAVAATVWAAPRVEGFSLVPAYASAATTRARGTGGTFTMVQIGSTWYGLQTFTTSGVFRRKDSSLTEVEVIVIGGGGGGGFGGGGGGQVVRNSSVLVTNPSLSYTYPVTVGAGGAGRAGKTVGSGAGGNAANPDIDVEWNTVPGADGGESEFIGSAVTVTAAGGGGGAPMLFYTTPGLGTTYPLSLGRGSAGASGGGGGGINASTDTNRIGGSGGNSSVATNPLIGPSFNRGATSIPASGTGTILATGQSLNPNAGFAGGPGGGWEGRGNAAGVTGTVGRGQIISAANVDGVRRMYGQGGGGGAARSVQPTGNSTDYLTTSGYGTSWNGTPFSGSPNSGGALTGSNSGGAGGFVGSIAGDEFYANGEAGSDGRGGGGGGGGFNWNNTSCPTIVGTASGRGGNGIVIIRYPIAPPTP